MRGLIHLLTLAAFATHMVVGCCWHHAHVDVAARRVEAASHRACPHQNHHPARGGGDACHDDDPAQHGSDHESSECGGTRCTFIASAKVRVETTPLSLIVPPPCTTAQPLLQAAGGLRRGE